jgi:hypothetical protein
LDALQQPKELLNEWRHDGASICGDPDQSGLLTVTRAEATSGTSEEETSPICIDFHCHLDVVVLSPEFYREITMHPIPTDLQADRALSGPPAALDLYN